MMPTMSDMREALNGIPSTLHTMYRNIRGEVYEDPVFASQLSKMITVATLFFSAVLAAVLLPAPAHAFAASGFGFTALYCLALYVRGETPDSLHEIDPLVANRQRQEGPVDHPKKTPPPTRDIKAAALRMGDGATGLRRTGK